jgi:hypothetical protein
MTAKTTEFIFHYGYPTQLYSDQGANFTGKIIQEICKITVMVKSRTTPYHPMGNGMSESFNRTLFDMLGTLHPDQKTKWKEFVVSAYNCTRHESTGQTPYFLMFGSHPRITIDLTLIYNGCRSVVVVLSLSKREVVSSSPARAGRVKPKTFKISSDCSFAKSTAFRSKNHGPLGYDLKNGGVARKRTLTAKSHKR